jgi:hypothetical protein
MLPVPDNLTAVPERKENKDLKILEYDILKFTKAWKKKLHRKPD